MQTYLLNKDKYHLNELFASKHYDYLSVDCIEDKCYVLTLNDYTRFKSQLESANLKQTRQIDLVVPECINNSRKLPINNNTTTNLIDNDNVFFCRYVYDFRMKRLTRNIFK